MFPASPACQPYTFAMSPCIKTLFVSFFRNFLTALFIASAPSLTLNPTCCSCISAMMWSACWSTATDSISFRESQEVQSVVILFSLIRPDCSPLLLAEQCWLAATGFSQLCCQAHRPHVGPIHERAQSFENTLQSPLVVVSRPRSARFSTGFRHLQQFTRALTACIIASAPSLTLNPTCCSCISATMWSACWSTATDSISFR